LGAGGSDYRNRLNSRGCPVQALLGQAYEAGCFLTVRRIPDCCRFRAVHCDSTSTRLDVCDGAHRAFVVKRSQRPRPARREGARAHGAVRPPPTLCEKHAKDGAPSVQLCQRKAGPPSLATTCRNTNAPHHKRRDGVGGNCGGLRSPLTPPRKRTQWAARSFQLRCQHAPCSPTAVRFGSKKMVIYSGVNFVSVQF